MAKVQAMSCSDDLIKIKVRMTHDGGNLLDVDGPLEELDDLHAFLQKHHSNPCKWWSADRDHSQTETGRRSSLNQYNYQSEQC